MVDKVIGVGIAVFAVVLFVGLGVLWHIAITQHKEPPAQLKLSDGYESKYIALTGDTLEIPIWGPVVDPYVLTQLVAPGGSEPLVGLVWDKVLVPNKDGYVYVPEPENHMVLKMMWYGEGGQLRYLRAMVGGK